MFYTVRNNLPPIQDPQEFLKDDRFGENILALSPAVVEAALSTILTI